ncbi:MAG: hypothetical protein BJ554DRAFT_4232 [Olpidium bornovanus]|uniref:Zuotin-like zuotin homology domain-containing protein n=1 Tax=Olpidium bornovanus TaxID=278681 RepID=A0A8H7ZMI2_9FUNG|nr:MAG: hypothetical protein BJ554DRAFT_4232 [Olpidium bornovanus]
MPRLQTDDPSAGGAATTCYEAEGTTVDCLMKYFSASCYQGYGDDRGSFYTVYRELFARLSAEEDAAAAVDQVYGDDADDGGSGLPDPALKVPFGDGSVPFVPSYAADSPSSLKAFYVAWEHLATKKSFRWRDKWRLSEAPDRRYRRAMEKENKKARSDAKKEYNDTVRVRRQRISS